MSRKNKKTIIPSITLTRYAAEGKSVAHMEDGKTILVTGGVPGDEVTVIVQKNKKSFAEGKVLKVITPSEDRITPFCLHFGVCGGCKWQMLPYEKQLEYKQIQVKDQLERIGHLAVQEIEPIMGSKETKWYRNKLEFTFCTDEYIPQEVINAAAEESIEKRSVLGFHAPGRFDKVVEIETCYLQAEPTNAIKNFLRTLAFKNNWPFYNHRTHEGWLRNIIIRVAKSGQVMVNLIVKYQNEDLNVLLNTLILEFPDITSLNYTINPKLNDSIYDLEVQNFHGKEYIEEYLEEFKFKISPKSFFQTNTVQAENLYKITRNYAQLTGNEIVYDLYCGTGSIGIFLSKMAKKVVGIEVVEEAIEDAKINARWNEVDHCHFFAGDAALIATDRFFNEHGKPDVIITDPPRAGMHEKLINQLLTIAAPRIVYVSCNPATQARDLQLLQEKYEVKKIQPVDMFPHTHHIETVALLEIKQNTV